MDTLRFDGHDPDYFMLFNSNINNENIFEKNARTTTAKKISTIIESEFLNEINKKKIEIYKIYKNLNKGSKMLHYLRFAIISDFYNQESIYNNDLQTLKQTRLHCTVTSFAKSIKNIECTKNCFEQPNKDAIRKRKSDDEYSTVKKKFIQCKNSKNFMANSLLATSTKIKKRIIIGNFSKWIVPDFRDGNATHKWTIYIRDNNKYDIGQFISKVRFFLHPSYKPNDVVELISTPYYLSRYGWGEFPVRVQLHFTNSFNKPVDIIHYLKLDRTFTGLQTIGSETIVDLWINIKDNPFLTSNIIESNSNDYISDSEKDKLLNISKNDHFFKDHNYIESNLRFNDTTSNSLQKSKEYTDFSLQILKDKPYTLTKSSNNLKINNISIKRENINVWCKSEQLSLIPKSNALEDSIIKYCSIKDKQESKYTINTIENLIQNSLIDNIYFTYDNVYYEEHLKKFVSLIEFIQPTNLFNTLKFIMKRIPLITTNSSKSCYKLLYSCISECFHQFSKYSKGKQQSLERYRAIYALNIIKNTKYFKGTYNVNEFILWARRYCYSPISNLQNIHKVSVSNEFINKNNINCLYQYTSTTSDQLNEWFIKCQKNSTNLININSKNIDQIDILNIPINKPDSLSTYNNLDKKNTSLLIKYPDIDEILYKYVCNYVQQIGIKLVNEEIIPGVLHHSASVLMTKAVQYLIDDLIRIAFSCALDKSKNENSMVFIKLNDMRMALLKKEEFDIFTNAGLGSEG